MSGSVGPTRPRLPLTWDDSGKWFCGTTLAQVVCLIPMFSEAARKLL